VRGSVTNVFIRPFEEERKHSPKALRIPREEGGNTLLLSHCEGGKSGLFFLRLEREGEGVNVLFLLREKGKICS